MAKKYANFFIARLSSDISASDVEIPITDLPKDDDNNVITEGKLVIDAKRPDKREVIGFTGVDGSKLTGVTRGLGRTLATTHQRNATIEMTVLGSDLTEVHHAAETVSDLPQYTRDLLADSVVPGTGVVTVVSGREVAISDMTYYINGIRLTKTGIPNKTLTASKDTYGYIDASGNVTYQEVAVNAATPATPANSIPFVKATTNASAVTANVMLSRSSYFLNTTSTGGVSTKNPYRVILLDNSNSGNAANYKNFPLSGLTIGATYEVIHTSPKMGITTNNAATLTVSMSVDGPGLIAEESITVGTTSYSNPRANLTGVFVATANTHTVKLNIAVNGSGLSLVDTLQRTTIKRIVGENGV